MALTHSKQTDATVTSRIQDGVGPTGVTVQWGGRCCIRVPTGEVLHGTMMATTHILTLSGEGPFTLSGGQRNGRLFAYLFPHDLQNITLSQSDAPVNGAMSKCGLLHLDRMPMRHFSLQEITHLLPASSRAGIEVVAGQATLH